MDGLGQALAGNFSSADSCKRGMKAVLVCWQEMYCRRKKKKGILVVTDLLASGERDALLLEHTLQLFVCQHRAESAIRILRLTKYRRMRY